MSTAVTQLLTCRNATCARQAAGMHRLPASGDALGSLHQRKLLQVREPKNAAERKARALLQLLPCYRRT